MSDLRVTGSPSDILFTEEPSNCTENPLKEHHNADFPRSPLYGLIELLYRLPGDSTFKVGISLESEQP